MNKSVSGTYEWADGKANLYSGCSNGCWYCYARAMAARVGRRDPLDWTRMVINPRPSRINQKWQRVMFPTAHDITPANVEECIQYVIKKILKPGKSVLIVTKPNGSCIIRMTCAFAPYMDQVMVRFTIGSMNDNILNLWEPGAPDYQERRASLIYAHEIGYATSVSCEPMLDNNIEDVVDDLLPWVTDAIWIGKMNQTFQRLELNRAPKIIRHAGVELMSMHSDARIWEIYNWYKDNPKVKWKDSIKKIVGIARPVKAGMDI